MGGSMGNEQELRQKNINMMIRCLQITQSDNDGEALAALRKANMFRERLGLTWDQVISVPQQARQASDTWSSVNPEFRAHVHPWPSGNYNNPNSRGFERASGSDEEAKRAAQDFVDSMWRTHNGRTKL